MSFNRENIKVGDIIYRYYIKHERLNMIVPDMYFNTDLSSINDINLYIDLYSVLHSVFSEHYRVDITDDTAIISGLLNMCAHYKSFFKSLGVHCNICMIMSYNVLPYNMKRINYNIEFLNKSRIPYYRDYVDKNLYILEKICRFIPDIYFFKSEAGYEVDAIIAYIIEEIATNLPNIVITSDPVMMGLLPKLPYTSLLIPKKSYEYGDVSYMIPFREKAGFKEEFWNCFCNIRAISTKNFKNYEISPVNISWIFAMNKYPERGIRQCTNINRAIKLIYDTVGTEDIKIMPEQLNKNPKFIQPEFLYCDAYFNCLDVDFQELLFRQSTECDLLFKDSKIDNFEKLRKILSSEHFRLNPIDIYNL